MIFIGALVALFLLGWCLAELEVRQLKSDRRALEVDRNNYAELWMNQTPYAEWVENESRTQQF
jgi:hypothetical protein